MTKYFSVQRNYRNDKPSSKFQLTPPEEMIPAVWYAITLSRNNARIDTLNKGFSAYLAPLREHITPFMDYKLYSELSKTGKLHYHGICKFESYEDIFNFYFKIGHMLDTTICIKPIDDMDVWKKYYKKSKHFRFMYERANVPYRLVHTRKIQTLSV